MIAIRNYIEKSFIFNELSASPYLAGLSSLEIRQNTNWTTGLCSSQLAALLCFWHDSPELPARSRARKALLRPSPNREWSDPPGDISRPVREDRKRAMIAIRTFNCWAYTVRYRARCGTHDGENKKNGEKKRKELECACVAAAQRSSLPLPAPPVPFFFLGSLVHRPLHLRVTCAGTRPATSAPPRPATSGTGATNTHTQTPSPDFGRSLNGGT